VDVPGAESKFDAYCQVENELASASETFNELPKFPGYLPNQSVLAVPAE